MGDEACLNLGGPLGELPLSGSLADSGLCSFKERVSSGRLRV